jgi:hypothetical protein
VRAGLLVVAVALLVLSLVSIATYHRL